MLKTKSNRFGFHLAGLSKLSPNLVTGAQNLGTVIFSDINFSLRVINTLPSIPAYQLPHILKFEQDEDVNWNTRL